jgi:hypothetical protein
MNPYNNNRDDVECGLMPSGFEPGEMDIMCGRGSANGNREGNNAFTEIIQANLHLYLKASSRVGKTAVVAEILDRMHSSGARFLKKDVNSQRWRQMNRGQAHVKIGHAIRDMIRHHGKDVSTLRDRINRSNEKFHRANAAKARNTHFGKRQTRSRSLSDLPAPKTLFSIDKDISGSRSSYVSTVNVVSDVFKALNDMYDVDPSCDDNNSHPLPGNSSGNLRNIFDETPVPAPDPCDALHDDLIDLVSLGLNGTQFQRYYYNSP